MNGQAGKGDALRPVNREDYDANFERVFGKCCQRCGRPLDVCKGHWEPSEPASRPGDESAGQEPQF